MVCHLGFQLAEYLDISEAAGRDTSMAAEMDHKRDRAPAEKSVSLKAD